MKKILLLLWLLLSVIWGFSQPVVGRSGPANTVKDSRWMAQFNAFLPRYTDTTEANIASNIGIDSCGAVIYTYTGNTLWYRACSPKKWTQVGSGGGGSPITTVEIIDATTWVVCYEDGSCDTVSVSGDGNYWSLAGNTVGSGNKIIGTIDNRSFPIYTNNTFAAVVDSNQRLGLGTRFPTRRLSIAEKLWLYEGGVGIENHSVVRAASGQDLQIYGGSSIALVPNIYGAAPQIQIFPDPSDLNRIYSAWISSGAVEQLRIGLAANEGYVRAVADSTSIALGSSGAASVYIDSSRFSLSKSLMGAVAANDLSLPFDGNLFTISGSTQINAISTFAWQPGSIVYLTFTGTPIVKNNTAGGAGTAPILLAGRVDYNAEAGDVIAFQYDGSDWKEIGRSLVSSSGGGGGTSNLAGFFPQRYQFAEMPISSAMWALRTNTVGPDWRDGVMFDSNSDTMWLYGGWFTGGIVYSDIYYSVDNGATWTDSGRDMPFAVHTVAYLRSPDGYLYFFGGDYLSTSTQRRTCYRTNTNGRTWETRTTTAPWSSILAAAWVDQDGTLYRGGGQITLAAGSGSDSIWYSTDGGSNWTLQAASMNILAKNIYGQVQYFNGRVVLAGGGVYDAGSPTYLKTTYSWDANNPLGYTQLDDIPISSGRQYAGTVVWDGKMWFMDGNDGSNQNDVVFLNKDFEWEVYYNTTGISTSEITATHASAIGVHNDQIIRAWGNTTNDCYALERSRYLDSLHVRNNLGISDYAYIAQILNSKSTFVGNNLRVGSTNNTFVRVSGTDNGQYYIQDFTRGHYWGVAVNSTAGNDVSDTTGNAMRLSTAGELIVSDNMNYDFGNYLGQVNGGFHASGSVNFSFYAGSTNRVNYSDPSGNHEASTAIFVNTGGTRMGIGSAVSSPATNMDSWIANTGTLTNITQNITGFQFAASSTYSLPSYTGGYGFYTTNNNATKPKAGIWSQNTGSGSYMYLGTSDDYAIGITKTNLTLDPLGGIILAGREQNSKGSNVAAANDLTVGNGGNLFAITGNTQINALTTTNWQAGSEVAFIFTGAPLLKNNTAGGANTATMLLAGRTDFQAAAGDYISFHYDGTNWYETRRVLASSSGGGGFTTADNGLTANTATNVQLGGTLIQNTTIATTASFGLTVSGDVPSSTSNGTLIATNNHNQGVAVYASTTGSSGIAITASSQFSYGVFTTTVDGTGLSAQATGTGIGLYAFSQAGTVAARVQTLDASTNTVIPVLEIKRTTGGTAASGIGSSIDFITQTTTSEAISSQLMSKWTTATHASRVSEMQFWGVDAATLAQKMVITGAGIVGIGKYSSLTASRLEVVDDAIGSGSIIKMTSASTAAASNTQKILEVSLSGANATSDQTTFAIHGTNTHTGSGSTINVGIYGSVTNGSSASVGVWGQAAASQYGVRGTTVGGAGVFAEASSTGTGVQATSVSGIAGGFSVNPSSTNSIVETVQLLRTTSGTPANGLGASLTFTLETSTNASAISAQIASTWTDVTHASRTGDLQFFTTNSGTSAIKLSITGAGAVIHVGRHEMAQGADVASVAGAIALGDDGNTFELTGTNAVTLISNLRWQNGSTITLLFTSTASLTDGTANSGTDIGMELAGNINFTGSAGAAITLRLSEIGGTQRWREISRSVN